MKRMFNWRFTIRNHREGMLWSYKNIILVPREMYEQIKHGTYDNFTTLTFPVKVLIYTYHKYLMFKKLNES